ncbi:MAG: spinster family MFS transporter [Myxococcota bacterium]
MSVGPASMGNDDGGESGGSAPSRRYSAYVLGVLFLVQIVNMADRQMLAIVMDDIGETFEVSDTAMGFLSGLAFAIFYTIAGLPIARWADTGVRRSILALGILVWSAMTAASGLARSFAQLAIARVGVGVGEATATPTSHSLVSDYFPEQSRGKALAVLAMGASLGAMIGNIAAGVIADAYGWRSAFFILGIPGIFLALLLRFTVKEPVRGASDRAPTEDRTEPLGDVFRFLLGLPAYRHLLIAAAIHYFAHFGAGMWMPTYLIRVHSMTKTEVGTGLAAASIASVAGTFFGGWLADRMGPKNAKWYFWLPALGTIAALPFWVLTLMSETGSTALAWAVPYYFCSAIWSAPMQATSQSLARPRMRGMSAAITSFVITMVGMGLGPLAIGAISDAYEPTQGAGSIRTALLMLAVVNLWALVHNVMGARTIQEDLRAKEVSLN